MRPAKRASTAEETSVSDSGEERLKRGYSCPSPITASSSAPSSSSVLAATTSIPISMSSPSRRRDEALKRERHVRFSPDSKQHDGLHPSARLLDRLLIEYIVKQQSVGVGDVVAMAQGDYHLLVGLRMRLMELCTRLAQAKAVADSGSAALSEFCMEDVGVPVLPAGGGSGTRLMSLHLPYLIGLHKVVTSACNTVAMSR